MTYKTIPGNPKYKISKELNIINHDGRVCDLTINNDQVTIELFGKTRTVRLTWLMLVSWYELADEEMVNNAIFGPTVNGLTTNPVGHWIFFMKSMEARPGYRILPSHCKYAISIDGDIRDIKTWNVVSSKVYGSQMRYPTCTIYNPLLGEFSSARLHRLVASVWCYNADPTERNIVDHLDSDPSNCHGDNLEWVTNRENILRYARKGTDQTIPVIVRDVKTNEEYEAFSISHAGEYIGLTITSLTASINYRRPGLYLNRYEMKEKGDDTPWRYTVNDLPTLNSKYEITVVHINGDVELVYGGIAFKKVVNRYVKTALPCGVHRLAEIFRRSGHVRAVDVVDLDPPVMCEAKCTVTGHVTKGKSFADLGRILGIKRQNVWNYVTDFGPKYICEGYRFRRLSDKPWPIEIIYTPCRNQRILVTNIESGVTVEYESKRRLAREINIRRATLNRALRDDRPFNGYTFKQIDTYV